MTEFLKSHIAGNSTNGWYFSKFEQCRAGTVQFYAHAPKITNQIGNRRWPDKYQAFRDLENKTYDCSFCCAGD